MLNGWTLLTLPLQFRFYISSFLLLIMGKKNLITKIIVVSVVCASIVGISIWMFCGGAAEKEAMASELKDANAPQEPAPEDPHNDEVATGAAEKTVESPKIIGPAVKDGDKFGNTERPYEKVAPILNPTPSNKDLGFFSKVRGYKVDQAMKEKLWNLSVPLGHLHKIGSVYNALPKADIKQSNEFKELLRGINEKKVEYILYEGGVFEVFAASKHFAAHLAGLPRDWVQKSLEDVKNLFLTNTPLDNKPEIEKETDVLRGIFDHIAEHAHVDTAGIQLVRKTAKRLDSKLSGYFGEKDYTLLVYLLRTIESFLYVLPKLESFSLTRKQTLETVSSELASIKSEGYKKSEAKTHFSAIFTLLELSIAEIVDYVNSIVDVANFVGNNSPSLHEKFTQIPHFKPSSLNLKESDNGRDAFFDLRSKLYAATTALAEGIQNE